MIFDDTYENKKLLERYENVFNGIMDKIKKIDDDWLEYSKDYVKIKLNSEFTIKRTIKILQYNCNY